MALKQIASSKVHPGTQMKEGEWRFAARPRRLFHKYFGILHEFWPGEPLFVDGSNKMRPRVNFRITGAFASATKTITVSADDTDVSGINILFINPGAALVIGGFTGGVAGQMLFISALSNGQDITLEHNKGVSDQDVFLHTGGDEALSTEYGGWTLACDGSDWYDTEHSKHV